MSVGKHLEKSGIFELVTQEEIARVVGTKEPSHRDWSRKDWSLLRQAGQALHADYAMIMERTISGPPPVKSFETVLINVETGRRFRVVSRLPIRTSPPEEVRQMQTVAYNEIFRDARSDILATAIRKGRSVSPGFFAGQPVTPEKRAGQMRTAPVPQKTETTSAKPAAPSSVPQSAERPSRSQEIVREVDYEKGLSAEAAKRGRPSLAVYALDTLEPYRVISLILTEALRQELFRLGIFDLVNREDIVRVLEEMALQQTGLVNEKEAVKAGRGLEAKQIILGRFGTLNKTSILQVKRVDVETQRALGFGVLQCEIGQEEELLQKMPDLAREISRNR